MIDPHLQNHFGQFGYVLNSIRGTSYVGIFLLSMFVSYVIPLPEVVLLIMLGFVAKMTGFDLGLVILTSIVGTAFGDNIVYRLSYFGNKYVQHFNRKMRANKLIKYENLAVDNIGKTIFFLRLVTGVRFFGPVLSGTLGVRWRKFLPYNGMATVIHSVAFIMLGFYAHGKIVSLVAEVEIVRNIMFLSSVFIIAILLRIFSKK